MDPCSFCVGILAPFGLAFFLTSCFVFATFNAFFGNEAKKK